MSTTGRDRPGAVSRRPAEADRVGHASARSHPGDCWGAGRVYARAPAALTRTGHAVHIGTCPSTAPRRGVAGPRRAGRLRWVDAEGRHARRRAGRGRSGSGRGAAGAIAVAGPVLAGLAAALVRGRCPSGRPDRRRSRHRPAVAAPDPVPPPPDDGRAAGAAYAWPLRAAAGRADPVPGARRTRTAPGTAASTWPGRRASPCRAAREGTVVFAGQVAGRGVVSVQHPDGLRTTYEPVQPGVAAGARVGRGEPSACCSPATPAAPRCACTGGCGATGSTTSTRSCCCARPGCGCCRCPTRGPADHRRPGQPAADGLAVSRRRAPPAARAAAPPAASAAGRPATRSPRADGRSRPASGSRGSRAG